jgi:hypothetical protein
MLYATNDIGIHEKNMMSNLVLVFICENGLIVFLIYKSFIPVLQFGNRDAEHLHFFE